MGRVASAGNNAPMQSFRALPHSNVLNAGPRRTRAELHYAITYGIEHTSNQRRRQRGLGRLTPNEFELAFTTNNSSSRLGDTTVSIRPTTNPHISTEWCRRVSRRFPT